MLNRAEKQKKEKKKKKYAINIGFKAVVVMILCMTALLALVGSYLLSAYENSVLSIYAEQQDAYVQLVLDQINLQSDREDEEIITDILGSLDASNRKYWTFSKDQTLLFVKDVTETNRYKGFSTPTFYTSGSASEFVEHIKLNHVSHAIINMDDEKYVASGVLFQYNDFLYRICLLTNETFILDNNVFLSSKITLYIYLGVLLITLLLLTMILSNLLDIRGKKIQKLQNKTERLNCQLQKLESELEFVEAYHTRWSLFAGNTMDLFIHKLEERNVRPVVLFQISFHGQIEREIFLEKAQVLLDDKILRFSSGADKLILVFVQYHMEKAKSALKRLKEERYSIEKAVSCENKQNLWDVYQEFLKDSEEERAE